MRRDASRLRGAARQRGFLDFSFPELAIIFGVALMVLGPKKLPAVVGQIGRWVGRAKFMARQFREQLEQEVNAINAVQPISNPPPAPPVPPVPAEPVAGTVEHAAETIGPPAPPHELAGSRAQPFFGESVEQQAAQDRVAPALPHPDADIHPEAQMYFAVHEGRPQIVFSDPLAESAADLEAPAAQPAGSAATGTGSPGAPPPPGTGSAPGAVAAHPPGTPASVEVIFPHDHE